MQYRTLGRTSISVQLALGFVTAHPGVDLAPGEKNVTPPALADPSLRRR